MNKQRPLLIVILAIYIFTPSIFKWMIDADGHWYRPFIVWLAIIVLAYILQLKRSSHDI
ncbi:MAG: hypothetical protein K6L81_08280 [Agarilytica sp.]